jgi:hypothetical protein
MKKGWFAALALALLLTGCAGQSSDSLATYTASDAQALIDAGAFSGQMEEVDSYVVSLLYGIDEDTITECASYMAINSSVSADEVTVLVLTSEDAAQAAVAACEKRVEEQIESCASYCPDQVPKLEDAVILQRGYTVLFAVGDQEALPQALENLALN